MATQFENFVNLELPKRIATNENPLNVQAGKVPVTTGVGLLTEFKDYNVGTSSTESILVLIDQFIVFNEVPICDVIDTRLFNVIHPFKPESLCIYLNGIRLMNGTQNDFTVVSSTSFRLNNDVDYESTDNILIDYKRSDLGI
jgi:hypothetical protein